MKAIEIATDAASVTALDAAERRIANARQPGDAQRQVHTRAFFDLTWTYREGFDQALARVPAAVWCDPAARNWERVKHNGTREVWRATIEGETYFLKYYRRHGWLATLKEAIRGPACLTEWNGGIFALRAGIPAVRPAGFTVRVPCNGHDCALLVTEAIEPAYPLNEFWLNVAADDQPRRRRADADTLIEQLAEMIAHAHQSGFQHLDMHAANILVQTLAPRSYRTVFVDLQSARLGVPIDDQAVVRNLAQLNQWFRKHAEIGVRLRFLRAYLRWRNEYEHAFAHGRALGLSFEQLVAALDDAAKRQAERISAQRDRRLLREGRYFSKLRGGGWRGMATVRCKHETDESRASGMVLDRAWWRQRLTTLTACFESANLCKNSHSAQVARALFPHEDANLPVILKRPLARNWRRALRQALGPSRAARAWQTGHALLHRDVPTARPLAFVERRLGPLLLDSVLVTEAVPGGVDLETYLKRGAGQRTPRDAFRHKRALLERLVWLIRRLQDSGFCHRDCKASNVLVITQPQLRMLWIDMDGIEHVGELNHEQRLLPLVRLHVSLLDVPGLTRGDRVRFLKRYLARFGARTDAWRALWREIAPLADQKRRAKEVRRRWKLAHYGRE